MTKPTLYRSSVELHAEGRNLLGIAFEWDKPARVRDGHGPFYLESLARSSCDETLRRMPEPRPVFDNHEYKFNPTAQALGVVSFQRSEEGLIYSAMLSRTRKADEVLELVNDGAMRDVSPGFWPIQETKQQTAAGLVTVRTEIGLRELSLAPTGFGQYPGAKVLAVRSDTTFSEIGGAVSEALEGFLFPATDGTPPGVWICVEDLTDSWVVYSVMGEQVAEEAEGLWQVTYTFDPATDAVAFKGQPVSVDREVSYVPTAQPETERSLASGLIVPALDVPGDAPEAPARAGATATPHLDALRAYRRRRGF